MALLLLLTLSYFKSSTFNRLNSAQNIFHMVLYFIAMFAYLVLLVSKVYLLYITDFIFCKSILPLIATYYRLKVCSWFWRSMCCPFLLIFINSFCFLAYTSQYWLSPCSSLFLSHKAISSCNLYNKPSNQLIISFSKLRSGMK